MNRYTILTLLFILKLHRGIVAYYYTYSSQHSQLHKYHILCTHHYVYNYIFIYIQQDLTSCKRFSLTTAIHSSIASFLLTSPRLRHRYTRLLSRRQTLVSGARMTPAPTHTLGPEYIVLTRVNLQVSRAHV